ncbi:long-chain fatty acid--CoA ligase [Ottowia sp.]|uniref:long-chain fatty acid--CoA ligase n=1 Tax=Ottowia sp. TaxID=1898956 RepID=UPI0025E9119F|nr:long-chain fatty acid--CoA ligase [Ottowia sp.]MBK6748292.1 long-chain fatty acid--CoA ligase [Ottowia sp.]
MRTHFKFWPKTLPHDLAVPATSLWHNLRVSAERYPDKVAIVFLGRETTYRELAAQVDALAGTLHAMGVQRGDRVILDMQNSAQLVVAHFAILRANAVVVPVNPMNRAEEIKHYISDSDAKVAITTGDLAAEIAAASDALPPEERLAHLIVTQFSDAFDANAAGPEAPVEAWRDWLATRHPLPALAGGQVTAWTDALSAGHPAPEHTVGAGDMALLPYTSGTTGLPKGCIHLHSSLMHNAVAGMYWGQATSEVVGLVVVPLFHITGIVSVLHCTVAASGTMVIMPRWDREMAGRLISGRKVTSWTNIPTMVVDLLASPNFASFDMSSLSYIGGGGAAMPQAVAQRLLEQYGLRYIEGYGMTETSAPSHSNPMDHPKQQCLGIPFISTDARVVDPDTLKEQPVGEAGEIIVHGPQVFQGYWKRPDATADTFIEFEGRRFLRTGDLARVDEDGYFFMTDRLKRMINASGFKVWPAEVELLMYKHPAIQEACIIATKDAYRGESVKAVVVLRPTHQDTTAEDIIGWCRENMAVYKVPRVVQFVDSLPKSGSGKVMWRTLQEAEEKAAA